MHFLFWEENFYQEVLLNCLNTFLCDLFKIQTVILWHYPNMTQSYEWVVKNHKIMHYSTLYKLYITIGKYLGNFYPLENTSFFSIFEISQKKLPRIVYICFFFAWKLNILVYFFMILFLVFSNSKLDFPLKNYPLEMKS